MSYTEHHRGTLTKVFLDEGQTKEDFAREYLKSNNITVGDYYKDKLVKCLVSECYNEILLVNGELYYINDRELTDDDEICQATLNEDGTITYEVRFYNGGAGLDEAIGYAVDKMNKE